AHNSVEAAPDHESGRINGRERALALATEVPDAPQQAAHPDDQYRQADPSRRAKLERSARLRRYPQRNPKQHAARQHQREERGPKPQHRPTFWPRAPNTSWRTTSARGHRTGADVPLWLGRGEPPARGAFRAGSWFRGRTRRC